MNRTDFQQIIEEYWDMAFRIAFNWYGNRHDAEDTTQEVMFKLYQNVCLNGKCFDSDEQSGLAQAVMSLPEQHRSDYRYDSAFAYGIRAGFGAGAGRHRTRDEP